MKNKINEAISSALPKNIKLKNDLSFEIDVLTRWGEFLDWLGRQKIANDGGDLVDVILGFESLNGERFSIFDDVDCFVFNDRLVNETKGGLVIDQVVFELKHSGSNNALEFCKNHIFINDKILRLK